LPGAYAMAIELTEKAAVRLSGRSPITLPDGRYLYCGSAKGPGGLKARLARHMRRGKSVHWHVDQLTERGLVVGSWIFLGSDECDPAAAAVRRLPAWRYVCAGSNSSRAISMPSQGTSRRSRTNLGCGTGTIRPRWLGHRRKRRSQWSRCKVWLPPLTTPGGDWWQRRDERHRKLQTK